MVETVEKGDRFSWRLLFFAAIGALILFLPLTFYAYDIGELLYVIVIVPVISLVLLIAAIVIAIQRKRLKSLSILSMLVVYGAVTLGLFLKSYDIRTAIRWFLGSKAYKAEVLAQSSPANGELRHIEWDGWGWSGNDTVVYLVFDPTDALSAAAKEP